MRTLHRSRSRSRVSRGNRSSRSRWLMRALHRRRQQEVKHEVLLRAHRKRQLQEVKQEVLLRALRKRQLQEVKQEVFLRALPMRQLQEVKQEARKPRRSTLKRLWQMSPPLGRMSAIFRCLARRCSASLSFGAATSGGSMRPDNLATVETLLVAVARGGGSAADLAVAIDPDPVLKLEAEQRGWPIRSLRGG